MFSSVSFLLPPCCSVVLLCAYQIMSLRFRWDSLPVSTAVKANDLAGPPAWAAINSLVWLISMSGHGETEICCVTTVEIKDIIVGLLFGCLPSPLFFFFFLLHNSTDINCFIPSEGGYSHWPSRTCTSSLLGCVRCAASAAVWCCCTTTRSSATAALCPGRASCIPPRDPSASSVGTRSPELAVGGRGEESKVHPKLVALCPDTCQLCLSGSSLEAGCKTEICHVCKCFIREHRRAKQRTSTCL